MMEDFDIEKVKLHTNLGFKDFIDPAKATQIITSKTFPHGDWNQISRVTKIPFPSVQQRVLPVDIRAFCMLVVTEVGANTTVPRHRHKEPIIRFITKGSLILNGVFYQAGDWIFVPEGVHYEIQTTEATMRY